MNILGESKTLEYKEMIPEKSIKYTKTVVAFSNGDGGQIIFGINDKTHEVVGIDNEDIFKKIDAITNAICCSCYPTIIPEISLKTIDGKTIIIVDIVSGRQKPYYIKSQGMLEGTYVRIGATTRLADNFVVKELMYEGQNRYYDQDICYGLHINDHDIDELCMSLKESAIKNCKNQYEREHIKDVTKNQLLNWGVLQEKDGQLLPTNAFALLSGNNCMQIKIQCGVFKGKTRAKFIDRREYRGSLQNHVDQAYDYVLSKINLGARINGLKREDVYELPEQSIREIIVNAVVHRSYLDPGNIQVALYDDRLEITSPGGLLYGVTVNRIKTGLSKIRNRAIASAFTYMGYIEEWGSGIPRVLNQFQDRNLKEPELMDYDGGFRVNFYRPTIDEFDEYLFGDQKVTKGDQDDSQDDQSGPKVGQREIEVGQNNSDKIKENSNEENNGGSKIDQSGPKVDQIKSEEEIVKVKSDKIHQDCEMMLAIIKENPLITQKEIGKMLNISKTTVQRRQKVLISMGLIEKVGKGVNSYFRITEKEE